MSGVSAAAPRPLPFARAFVAIGGIYVAQSVVGGMTFQGVPAVLRAGGTDLGTIALVSVAMLPWALKFIWAPLIERYRLPFGGGRRSRRIVVAGEIVVAVALLLLALFGQAGQGTLLWLLGVVALASATVDIACDAFAIEQLAETKRGWANVAQVGGSYFGVVIGSGLFVIVAAHSGWAFAAGAMAVAVLALTVPFALTREPGRAREASVTHRPSLGHALSRPEVRRGLLLTALFVVGSRIALGVGGPFLIDAGVPLATLGLLNGLGGAAAGLFGAVVGGFAVRRIGARRAVVAAAALQAFLICSFAALVISGLSSPETFATLTVLQAVSVAFGYVALYSLLMGVSSLLQAGVDFTLFQCADAFMAGLAGFGGGMLASALGYAAPYGVAAILSSLGLLAAWRLAPGLQETRP